MASPYAQREAGLAPAGTSGDVVALIARLLLVAMYFLSGVGKLTGFGATAAFIAAHGLPFPALGVLIAIVVEIGGALLLLVGWNSRSVAVILAVYTVVAGMLFHQYWADTDAAARMDDFINFWKNITIAGGFLMVFAFGPGRYSVDRRDRS